MGNNHSSAAKSGSSGSPPEAPPNDSTGSNSTTGTTSTPADSHSHHHHHHHHHLLPHKNEARHNPAANAAVSSAAPPEPSLAQATGSTIVSRPKSLPGTAVSSLSGSPHSNISSSVKPSEARPVRDEPTKPVDVPVESGSLRSHKEAQISHAQQADLDPYLVSNNSVTDMYLRGPPRLPLPIEEEVHTPGSPILAPEEGLPDVELGGESSDGLTRKSSALSATTLDDDESEELRVDKTRPVVPTKIEWRRGGDKIYVTGTIFEWNRKQRLHPVEGKPGHFATTVYILPGTHHLRFLADGIMQTSPDLPTTVDFGNNLVNYIEVNPDALLRSKQGSGVSKTETDVSQAELQAKEPPKPKGKAVLPPDAYASQIPQYLIDFDQPEDSSAYKNAVGAIEKLPTPPTLPGFLGKPILNAATLMKDDNSVLNMPNHTVLNHLATSSIKNNVLAVSATTRYHNKYVTTIMYKPTSTDEG
ncbi:galactose metabolism-related protein [Conoideocrella luteorostrata]|uniref:Galactose metabolism-related protein n=1 Tax=Conoideocrella luteorostrata TaxID=1105319 RepID=A0AAJ0CU83_9HYPO|nr:galactose metabolism-related protein [Conoideocrella luteorostrata]